MTMPRSSSILLAMTFSARPSGSARRVAALRPRIEEIACDLLSGLADLPPDRPVDLRERYTYQPPVKVICELFGVGDEATRAEVSRCADALFNIGEARP
jgi:2-hydroxy-5-methyl-1-naphthoate 7-hydroxylase